MPRFIPCKGDRVKVIYANSPKDFFGTVNSVVLRDRDAFMDVFMDNNEPAPRELLGIDDVPWLYTQNCWLAVGQGGI